MQPEYLGDCRGRAHGEKRTPSYSEQELKLSQLFDPVVEGHDPLAYFRCIFDSNATCQGFIASPKDDDR
jgi:hypothetical protein